MIFMSVLSAGNDFVPQTPSLQSGSNIQNESTPIMQTKVQNNSRASVSVFRRPTCNGLPAALPSSDVNITLV